MAAYRYLRIVSVGTYAGGDLALSALHWAGSSGRMDAAAVLASSHSPSQGSLAALQDDDPATVCQFNGSDVRSSGFWLRWDFGAPTNVPMHCILGALEQAQFSAFFTVQQSSDGANWVTLGDVNRIEFVASNTLHDVSPLIANQASEGLTGQIIACIYASSNGTNSLPELDPLNQSLPTWEGNFLGTAEFGLFAVARSTGYVDTGNVGPVVMPFFLGDSIHWVTRSANYYYDVCDTNVEFLTASGEVKAALMSRYVSYFSNALRYGPSLASTTQAPRSGSYPQTDGTLTFTAAGITFTDSGNEISPGYGTNHSFYFACDLSAVTSLRISGRAYNSYSGGGSTGTILRMTRAGASVIGKTTPLQSMSQISMPDVYAGSETDPAAARTHLREHTFFDVYHGGRGIIYGTVKELHTPANTPWRRRVLLIDERSRLTVRETWSDAATGAYEFRGIREGVKYTVLSYDHSGQYGAAVGDNITPEIINVA